MPELQLERDPHLGVRAGLERALRQAVRSGHLRPGARLPSSRELAVELAVARNTVADVYSQLVSEGYLVSNRGAGTRVATRSSTPAGASLARRHERDAQIRYDLRPGRPDLDLFPDAAWLAASRRALARARRPPLDYGDPRGPLVARETIAAYLARVRGVVADPDQIVLCAGYRQAVALVAAALRRQGRTTVAVESPGPPEVGDQIRHAGLSPIPLPVDGEGARTDLLHESAAEAAVLTPAHQFPTGVALSARRRTTLLDWAHRAGAVVLEDDYDSEFRYDRQPTSALQGLAPEHVIYAGSASKTLAPGLRLGWIAAPLALLDAIVEERWLADRQPSGLDHLILAELIDSAHYERHIRRARLHYRRRRDELAAALPPAIAGLNGERVRAGLHALVRLPAGTSEATVVERLSLAGVAVNPLARYGSDVGPGLVVGYATLPQHAWRSGLEVLAGILQTVVSSKG